MIFKRLIAPNGARLIIGLSQGVLLYLLYKAVDLKIWPATNGLILAPLILVASFVPIIGLLGWGNLRSRNLTLWASAVTALLVGLAIYDIVRDPSNDSWRFVTVSAAKSNLLPSVQLFFFTGVALFIAHSLVAAGDAERRYIAAYPRYFDVAWKHGVQLVLSIAFVGAFWGVLVLGARLFALIKIDFFWDLIRESWFSIPATTLALAAAIHVTDVRAGIVRGIRTLTLTLLSWLLPLMALIAAGFLLSLPFTGLEPLWSTRFGTRILLAVNAALVLLINAAYQDGGPEHVPPRPLRYAGSIGVAVLVPLVVITIYGLTLRVRQYGWTSDRIIAAAFIAVAACYALGYTWALANTDAWLKRIEITNVATAFAILGVLFVLFTPIADPARISVASQVARLTSGQISPQEFDYAYLRFDGRRYGREALEKLKSEAEGEHAAYVREQAEAALRMQRRGQRVVPPLTRDAIAANITMRPRERSLPEEFLGRNWIGVKEPFRLPLCLREKASRCDGFFVDLNDDGIDEIILIGEVAFTVVFRLQGNNWIVAGQLSVPPRCPSVRAALRSGQASAVMPIWRDLDVNGYRFQLNTQSAEDRFICP